MGGMVETVEERRFLQPRGLRNGKAGKELVCGLHELSRSRLRI